ncbi:probable LRR receptor-like serine/threonine-protein kinase At1g56140 isoform X2 [Rosa chinensis]|uniref:probable LRR receptor-like serine/threonine-protein kinase At1g56140 isoform X2 n=1 Tax=Rosa chinensis TaxID=74649 RepID=UPI000D08B9AF|nr:probable LRR receptor-like serine/threonine-protein kinase At1g56140 isoform X2 [Rosa chinensis]
MVALSSGHLVIKILSVHIQLANLQSKIRYTIFMSGSSVVSSSVWGLFLFIFGLCVLVEAQAPSSQPSQAPSSQPQATTDPFEARALNSVFQKWKIAPKQRQWNISGEPCSGAAIDPFIFASNDSYNPLIKCVCSNFTCHITELKVYGLDVIGELPEELWSLTSLTSLNLAQNYLTGPLSPSIGNLTDMQYLSLGINSLSGEIPKELGKLTDLISLAFGTNNFSGPLPSELGNLTKLEQIYIDSSGAGGAIPSTFANLQSLKTVWASDNEFTGRIPDFIGNWSSLTTLLFHGNSFEGPIPLTLSNLSSLTELRISDVSNGNRSSSLGFIKNMKSLNILVLRNNHISDVIPSYIGDYQRLSQLDLSFNDITGRIPDSLFNLSLLSILFLGNNKLNGTLPESKKSSLHTVDLSYNNLVGRFPSWVNEEYLQLNLVANNFSIETSNSSVLPSGLICLQKNFPCIRGPGINYNFGIKCGGPQVRSSNGIVYDKENETLGPATYMVNDENRWGVSNTGIFTRSNNNQYTINSSLQFTSTLDSVLFQTARLSASSLRYYGLGLQNGNYTVNLQFAEQVILDSTSWRSLGRRVFDIYIQGILVLKDFDIRKEAGASLLPLRKEYKAHVSENYLEIHLFWAGKGTCCVPVPGTYGPAISAIRATPDFIPDDNNNNTNEKKIRTWLIVGFAIGGGVLLLVMSIFLIVRRRKSPKSCDDEELLGIDVGRLAISYSELKTATNDFDPSNKLGEGGFGPVYKGLLNDGRVIAVKQLSAASHQGKNQFITEIATISAVQHNNLVTLYGFCTEGDKRLLVYEYLVNKSLDQALFAGERGLNLDWSTRFGICMGVARGLNYLHEESRLRIVHRDVKASNILLDSELIPKISDFGLAKLYDSKKTHMSTQVAGTLGYLAPEYAMRGHLTEKTDVFAFGVVALEIVSGRPNCDTSLDEDKIYLLESAWVLHESKREVELVDSGLSEFDEEEVRRVINIGLLCTQTSPTLRPSMSRVVGMLSGDIEVTILTSKPGYLTDWKFDDVSSVASTMMDMPSNGINTSLFNSTACTSLMGDAQQSPAN